ncbi:hypothetical protein QT969_16470 [Rhodococcus sp. CSLK01-03]|uniref:Uncharacterized protein n=1 Tax=Rhodococcus indonesiensis TaxID=3055869 RepID=A0ABT7RQE5_9NOCA|nr:hypothetical protein [Rhodococcus indonesiensis]MDM7489876.1 hypothetical protein [Rhodococcus indonesiensis]
MSTTRTAVANPRHGATSLTDLAAAADEHTVADVHQGQVFLGILHRENDSVTAALTTAETCARIERGSGSVAAAQRYESEVRRLRETQRELHCMIANLRARFATSGS